MQHATLVQLGVRWLSRQCSVVLYEAAAVKKEVPDVIGWAGPRAVLIECKVSRADFVRDFAKVTRGNPKLGMAQRRYYLCPAGVIQLADLPAKWGLLWAEKNGVTVQREARGFPQRNLLAEVEFTEITPDGLVRHPSFKGLREDKDAREVHLEETEDA